MEETKEIDLFKLFIWLLKTIKNKIILIGIIAFIIVLYGVYRNKTAPTTANTELVTILQSNLPHAGPLHKLTSTYLTENPSNLKGTLELNETVLNGFEGFTLDTTYKPNLILKIKGSNPGNLLLIKKAFLSFYNQSAKEDIAFEIQKSSTIIRKFNNRIPGNLLDRDSSKSEPSVTFKDRDQVEAYEKGLDYLRRKNTLEKDGAFTEIRSYNSEVSSAKPSLSKTIFLHLILGFFAGFAISALIEGYKLIKPLLKD